MKCFVISPFGVPFDEYYREIITPSAKSAGLEVVRADEVYGVRPIMEDIVTGIIEADVIIAEVTRRNPNVNYELGMAHALGKPVVIISQSADDIPFDYRHVRAILYDTNSSTWAKQLKKNISATLRSVLEKPRQSFLHQALDDFYQRSGEIGAWGLTGIYSTRQEMNIRVDSLLSELHDNPLCVNISETPPLW